MPGVFEKLRVSELSPDANGSCADYPSRETTLYR